MALVLMGCPPPVANNSASGGNASAGSNPQPKAIVVSQVSAGTGHTMILKTDGSLWAVGLNDKGQLGNAVSDPDADSRELNPVQVMDGVKQVSSGQSHTMIVKKNGTLWAVGDNECGQLGDASTINKSTPVQVKIAGGAAMTEVDQVSAGYYHTLILKKNGSLWAVGDNEYGQLGDGTVNDTSTPVAVRETTPDGDVTQPMAEVKQVSAGGLHTIIVKENGDLWAVGNNGFGKLGDGSTDDKQFPVQVMIDADNPMTNVAQVSTGAHYTMILKENGDLWAVGQNDNGQLGDGQGRVGSKEVNPVQVKTAEGAAMTGIAQVSAGLGHTMILKENGDLWAVGQNNFGQLGDGSTDERLNPVQVKTAGGAAMTNVAQVSAGLKHTMILKTNGTLWAVGNNKDGQLGNGKSGDDVKEVIPVEITVE